MWKNILNLLFSCKLLVLKVLSDFRFGDNMEFSVKCEDFKQLFTV